MWQMMAISITFDFWVSAQENAIFNMKKEKELRCARHKNEFPFIFFRKRKIIKPSKSTLINILLHGWACGVYGLILMKWWTNDQKHFYFFSD